MPVKTKKPPKTFAEKLNSYKTYNVDEEGFGNSFEWKQNFYKRMNFEEAQRILDEQDQTPEQILGITDKFYTFDWVKRKFRELIFKHHPDRGGTEEMAKKIIAAFESIKHAFGER